MTHSASRKFSDWVAQVSTHHHKVFKAGQGCVALAGFQHACIQIPPGPGGGNRLGYLLSLTALPGPGLAWAGLSVRSLHGHVQASEATAQK